MSLCGWTQCGRDRDWETRGQFDEISNAKMGQFVLDRDWETL